MPPTEKGRRAAERLVDAATVVLAREGFGGASVGRIAAEAGVPKRMVTYYFGTREALLARVVERFALGLTAGLAGPADDPARWLDPFWRDVAEDPLAAQAYFALLGGSRGGDTSEALMTMRGSFETAAHELIASCADRGLVLQGDADAFVALILALVRGLLLEWIEVGDSPALDLARRRAGEMVAASFTAA